MNTRRGFFGRLAAIAAGAFTARHVAAAPPAKPSAPAWDDLELGRIEYLEPGELANAYDFSGPPCRYLPPQRLECTLPCDVDAGINPGDLVSIRPSDGFAVRAEPGDDRPVIGFARQFRWRAADGARAECIVVMTAHADLGDVAREYRWLDDAPRAEPWRRPTRWNDTRNEPKGVTVWSGRVRSEFEHALKLQQTIDDVQRRQVAAGLPPFSDETIARWRRRHARR